MAHIEVTQENFEKEVLQSPVLTLVDFWAPWCAPCRILGPILEEVSLIPAYKDVLKVVKIDVDQNDELSEEYNITSIPSVKFFSKGKIVGEFVGIRQQDDLKKMIDELLSKSTSTIINMDDYRDDTKKAA